MAGTFIGMILTAEDKKVEDEKAKETSTKKAKAEKEVKDEE